MGIINLVIRAKDQLTSIEILFTVYRALDHTIYPTIIKQTFSRYWEAWFTHICPNMKKQNLAS
jgi:hypothetical protein